MRNQKIVSTCVYCQKGLTDYNLFYSACVQCKEAIKEACYDCFQIWRNKHPTRPVNVSINKWNGSSHLVDNWSSDSFDEYVQKGKYNILNSIQ